MKQLIILIVVMVLSGVGGGSARALRAQQTGNSGSVPNSSPRFNNPAQTNGSSNSGQSNSYIVSPEEDYLIGPSDIIEIRIEDAPELSGTFRLDSKGTVKLPIAGSIDAAGKRTDEVADEIAGRLRGGYLVNPIVTVFMRQSNSRAYFIQGAVRRPGIYQIEGRPSLLKLITIAGGLADNYGSTAFIMREKRKTEVAPEEEQKINGDEKKTVESNRQTEPDRSEPEEYSVSKVNINNLLRGNLDQNLSIEAGDIVHIPSADGFFVAGEVKSPGYFILKEGTTLRQAVSLAQGINYQADSKKSIIFREDATGKRVEIPIDIASVMSGKSPDMEIFANDIIMVPNNQTKSLTKNLLKSFSSSLPGLLLRGLGFW